MTLNSSKVEENIEVIASAVQHVVKVSARNPEDKIKSFISDLKKFIASDKPEELISQSVSCFRTKACSKIGCES